MWKIKQIAEADFGCEERLPGEKLKCLVILENEKGETRRLEVEDEWLTEQGLDEGSMWDVSDKDFNQIKDMGVFPQAEDLLDEMGAFIQNVCKSHQ